MADFVAFLVGLALGGFLNQVATALPLGSPLWAGRSYSCPQCRSALTWHEQVPLLGYLYQRGRCRVCAAPLPRRPPLLSLAAGLLSLALWLRFPWDLRLIAYGPFCGALLVLSAIDLEHRLLPDALTLPGASLGLLLALLLPHLSFWDSLLGALLGGGFFFLTGWAYERVTGRVGMGGGDVKLMAMIGAFLGVNSLPYIVFSSALLSVLAGLTLLLAGRAGHGSEGRTTHSPFGPFLAAGALLYLFFQGHIPRFYS